MHYNRRVRTHGSAGTCTTRCKMLAHELHKSCVTVNLQPQVFTPTEAELAENDPEDRVIMRVRSTMKHLADYLLSFQWIICPQLPYLYGITESVIRTCQWRSVVNLELLNRVTASGSDNASL